MRLFTLPWEPPFYDLLESLLPDFILAFTFFTSLCYAVLGKHFGRQRPAIGMSVPPSISLAVPKTAMSGS